MKNLDLSGQTILAFLAMLILGVLSMCLIWHAVPQQNQQLVTFITGAISGAITVGGGKVVADNLTSNANTTTVTSNPEN